MCAHKLCCFFATNGVHVRPEYNYLHITYFIIYALFTICYIPFAISSSLHTITAQLTI